MHWTSREIKTTNNTIFDLWFFNFWYELETEIHPTSPISKSELKLLLIQIIYVMNVKSKLYFSER